MAYLEVNNIQKSFLINRRHNVSTVRVLDGINFDGTEGDFITIIGPNGCGKTTLLNIMAGLIAQDSGIIKIDGHDNKFEEIGYIFQSHQDSLLPWRTVLDNIVLPLEFKGVHKEQRKSSCLELIENLGLQLPLSNYPYQISGGQRQLVCLVRSLITNPRLLLMDEPFNELDYQNRSAIHDKLLEIWRKQKLTIVFVSHMIEEALILGSQTVFFSSQPAQVIKAMKNNLPFERDHRIIDDPCFIDLRKQAVSIMKELT